MFGFRNKATFNILEVDFNTDDCTKILEKLISNTADGFIVKNALAKGEIRELLRLNKQVNKVFSSKGFHLDALPKSIHSVIFESQNISEYFDSMSDFDSILSKCKIDVVKRIQQIISKISNYASVEALEYISDLRYSPIQFRNLNRSHDGICLILKKFS